MVFSSFPGRRKRIEVGRKVGRAKGSDGGKCRRVCIEHCYIPSVFSLVACTGGCTDGPGPAFCAGAALLVEVVVVVLVGALVGYFRAAEPAAALAPLDAPAPMVFPFWARFFCWE